MSPPLFGLILSGGRSERMGQDKGALVYRDGLDQRTAAYELARPICERMFISCRRDQLSVVRPDQEAIIDEGESMGPASGLWAAHRAHPDAAWLVLACDLPRLDRALLDRLRESRNPAQDATAFKSVDGQIEPLCAIWEPSALRALARSGELSPRRVLAQMDCRRLDSTDPGKLKNVNTPQEYEEVLHAESTRGLIDLPS